MRILINKSKKIKTENNLMIKSGKSQRCVVMIDLKVNVLKLESIKIQLLKLNQEDLSEVIYLIAQNNQLQYKNRSHLFCNKFA